MNISDVRKPNGNTIVNHIDYDSEGNSRIVKSEVMRESSNYFEYPFLESVTKRQLPGGDIVRIPLMEALQDPDVRNILRTDLNTIMFGEMARMERTYTQFTRSVTSNKPQEEWLRDAGMGVIPKYRSGEERLQGRSSFEGGTTIVNNQFSWVVNVLMDWVRYDQINKIRQFSEELGVAAANTDEYEAYAYITNTANYTRNSTTSDNDVGANTQTLTWNADSFRTAKAIITTAKDRKSGAYLGYMPDTLIATPLLEVPIMQLLLSPLLQRQHGNTTAEAIGTGTTNPLHGAISRVIFSPWFGTSYQWALADTRRGRFIRQNVQGWQLLQETANVNSESFMTHDAIRYMINAIFGVGFTDDRAWFYSNSTTDATVS